MDALAQAGLPLDPQDAMAMSVARELKIMRFHSGSPPLFLRIMGRDKGEADLRHLQELERLLGGYINAPQSIVQTDDLVCGVFPYVTNQRVTRETCLVRNLIPQVKEVLGRLHAGGGGLAINRQVMPYRLILDRLQGHPGAGEAFTRYSERVFLPLVERLPAVPQHCDFTYVNCSVTPAGRLVVFDWEDYGLIRYPGFDLATFVCSHCHHGAGLDRLVGSPQVLLAEVARELGGDFLAAVDLDDATFVRLFPGYVGTFLALKQDGFGATVNARMRGLWQGIMQSAGWQATLLGNGG